LRKGAAWSAPYSGLVGTRIQRAQMALAVWARADRMRSQAGKVKRCPSKSPQS